MTVWRPVRVSIRVSVPVPNPVPVAPSVPISVAVAVRVSKARPIECRRDIELMKAGQFPFTKTVREVRFECPTIPEKGIVRISLCSSSPSKGTEWRRFWPCDGRSRSSGSGSPSQSNHISSIYQSINPSIHRSINHLSLSMYDY